MAQLSWLAACALPRWQSCPHWDQLYTLSWLHSPLPSPSLTLEHKTGARQRGGDKEQGGGLLNGRGASLRFFFLSEVSVSSSLWNSFLNNFRLCCSRQVTVTQKAWSRITAMYPLLCGPVIFTNASIAPGSTWMRSLSVVSFHIKYLVWATSNWQSYLSVIFY